MKANFWKNLPKPFFVLAPMAGVTDVVFREMIATRARPDVFYTEFVSVDGLMSEKGRNHLLIDLAYTENQRPIVAQIFGNKPEHFREIAQQVAEMGFDGIDINMGCPDKSVEKQGAGASLIKHPELAREIIAATIEGSQGLPVAVKTRLGYSRVDEYTEWLPVLLDTDITTLLVHLRTRKEMSKVPAHWELMGEITQMAHEKEKLIVGNGDVASRLHGLDLAEQSGCDGVMIGRGIFSDHWVFDPEKRQEDISVETRLAAMLYHTKAYEKQLPMKHFALMKKHFKVYTLGMPNATDLRDALMRTEDYAGVKRAVQQYLKNK